MHITPDELNLMFQGKAQATEHAAWADHILECPTCAARFQALHALHRQLQPAPARIPLRYLLGVAAVMAMAILPYLDRPVAAPEVIATTQVAQAETAQPVALAPPTIESTAPAAPRATAQAAAPIKAQPLALRLDPEPPALAGGAGLSILDRVAQVNYSQTLARWGEQSTLIDLIQQRSGSR